MSYILDKKEQRKNFLDYIKSLKENNDYNVVQNDYWTFFNPKSFSEILPEKGFKIHLSASINNALVILSIFEKYIRSKNICWKVLSNLQILEQVNIGLHGYSQIGKFITIYPYNKNILLTLLKDLEIIFKDFRCIDIPSDFAFMNSKVVFYRYGYFYSSTKDDKRNRKIPENVHIPIDDYFIPRLNQLPNHLKIIDLQKQNGKNSVFKVLNLKTRSINYLKEALPLGNIDIYNADSINRLQHEKKILEILSKYNFVPKVLSNFYVNEHYFLELELLNAIPLLRFMQNTDFSHTTVSILELIIKIAKLVDTMLKENVLYNDISFSNILIDNAFNIYFVDFEYCKIINDWNPPEIIAGCIGFYDAEYEYNDENRAIYSLSALLLYMENFKNYLDIVDSKHEEELISMMTPEYYKNSIFKEIYTKAFCAKCNNLKYFLNELLDIQKQFNKFI